MNTWITGLKVTTAQDKQDKTDLDAQIRINTESQKYLDETDKLFIRSLDSGKPMPEGMKEARQAARDAIV